MTSPRNGIASFVAALWTAMILGAAPGAAGPSRVAETARGHVHPAFIAGRCRLIPFDAVDFEDGGRRGWWLSIGGPRPIANMDVTLEHRIAKNGEWVVQVVGCTKNFIVLPIPTPYEVSVPLDDFPRVRRVKIVGANGFVRRRLPGR